MSDSIRTGWYLESTAPVGFPAHKAINVSAIEKELASGSLGRAVGQAAAIGLAALHTQVSALGKVTGNLSNSVMLRVAPAAGENKAFAEVGFAHEGGQHAHLVEYGTAPRAVKTKGVMSSWKKRGKWVGMGTYSRDFVTSKKVVGAMPAKYPLQKAMNKSRAQMTDSLYSQVGRVGTAAIEAGTKELKGSTFRRVQ